MATKRVWQDVSFHPGKTLAEELAARGMTTAELAEKIGRPVGAVDEIVREQAPITASTAWDLEDALGIDAVFWMNMQTSYDLNVERLRRTAAAATA